MKRRAVLLGFLVSLLFLRAPSGAEAGGDPFEGKTLEEIKRLIEKRMEERKKDREIASSFKSFFKREESKLVRTGLKLANAARSSGEFMQGEYLFRFGEYAKSLDLLVKCEKKNRKNRRSRGLLNQVHLLMAADYTYLGEPTKAGASVRQARADGAIGAMLQEVQKKLLEFPTRRRELQALKSARDLSPLGGPERGGTQWALCAFYHKSIFLPVEEHVELSWMLDTFSNHTQVRSGEAAWFQVQCAEKLLDDRQVINLAEKFRKSYPNHWASTQGDLLWSLAKAYFGKGALKDAKRTAELLKRKHPKFRNVESREVGNLMTECEKGIPKDRFSHGNPWNQWYKW